MNSYNIHYNLVYNPNLLYIGHNQPIPFTYYYDPGYSNYTQYFLNTQHPELHQNEKPFQQQNKPANENNLGTKLQQVREKKLNQNKQQNNYKVKQENILKKQESMVKLKSVQDSNDSEYRKSKISENKIIGVFKVKLAFLILSFIFLFLFQKRIRQTPNRNVITNMCNKLINFIINKKKSKIIIQKLHPQWRQYELKSFYCYCNRLKNEIGSYTNLDKFRNMWLLPELISTHPEFHKMIRILTKYYLQEIYVLIILNSRRIKKDAKIFHLKAKVEFLKNLNSRKHFI